MRDVFDRKSNSDNPPSPAACWGCDRPWDQCKPSHKHRSRFEGMTGLCWPGGAAMAYPARKDFGELGLDAGRVPERLELCVGCAVAYMEAFNRRVGAAGLARLAT
jgi:hypothetical protein